MEVDAVGWDSDGLGYDTPGDDVDGDEHAEGAALEDLELSTRRVRRWRTLSCCSGGAPGSVGPPCALLPSR